MSQNKNQVFKKNHTQALENQKKKKLGKRQVTSQKKKKGKKKKGNITYYQLPREKKINK